MGRPIGSVNRQKPFNDALLMTLRSDPMALCRIAAKLIERAQEGDLAAIREIADRLDGKPVPAIDLRDVPVKQLTDAQLLFFAAGGLPECADTANVLLIPPGPKSFAGIALLDCDMPRNLFRDTINAPGLFLHQSGASLVSGYF